MSSKYEALWRYIEVNGSDGDIITFAKAEEVADVEIGADFYQYRNELKEHGFQIYTFDKKEKWFEIRTL